MGQGVLRLQRAEGMIVCESRALLRALLHEFARVSQAIFHPAIKSKKRPDFLIKLRVPIFQG